MASGSALDLARDVLAELGLTGPAARDTPLLARVVALAQERAASPDLDREAVYRAAVDVVFADQRLRTDLGLRHVVDR